MKSLKIFIAEAQEEDDDTKKVKSIKKEHTETSEDTKTVIFNFTDINGASDLAKALDGETGITIDGTKIKVAATKDDANDLSDVLDTIKKTYSAAKKTEKTTNSETFSAKIKKIGKGLSALYNYIDDITGDDDTDEEE